MFVDVIQFVASSLILNNPTYHHTLNLTAEVGVNARISHKLISNQLEVRCGLFFKRSLKMAHCYFLLAPQIKVKLRLHNGLKFSDRRICEKCG